MNGIIPSPPEESSARAPWACGLAGGSRFVQRIRRRYEAQMDLLPPGPPVRETMHACWLALRANHPGGDALRILRQLVMERLVVLDV